MADLEHAYGFDPTCGHSLDRLLAIDAPDEPADAAAFWQEAYAATLATPLRIETSPVASPRDGFTVRLVHFDGWGGVRLGGWLVEPAGAAIERFTIVGHGYYNRPIEDISYHAGVAELFFGCRGLGVSRTAGISDQPAFHVLHGIEDKSTYVHRGCVADTWSAASALLELFPQAVGRLEYRGGSFGGGIGAMALAWDNRFVFGDLSVPSFGHHPLRLSLPCTGSGEAVRQKWLRVPEIYERTLRYFDAAVHARRIAVPVHFACALFDPAVPPPGQFAVHNAAPGPKALHVLRTGHHTWAGTDADALAAAAGVAAFRASAAARTTAKARLTGSPGVA